MRRRNLKPICQARTVFHESEARHRQALVAECGALEQRMEDQEEEWRREKRRLEEEIKRC